MADPAIWQSLIETGNPYVQQERQQKGLMGMMLLQEKQREMEDTQRLRDLYSSGQPVSPNQVMAINPKLGIDLQQAGNQALMQQLQAQDLINKQNEYQSKVYAQHMSPIAQDYFDDLEKGMPEQQAEQKFRAAVGQAQADIEQRFGISPQADFTKFSPMQIAQRAHSLGVDIPHLKKIEEQQRSQLAIQQKQTPGASELQQEWVLAPDGVTWMPKPNVYRQPSMGGRTQPSMRPPSQGQYQEPAPYQYTTPGGQKIMAYDLGTAAQALQELPEGPEKEAASKWLDEQWSNLRNPPKPKTKQELAIEEETGKERAKLQVQDEQDAENKLATIASMPSDDELMKYLNAATTGKGEEILKGPVASFFHVDNAAQAADTVLDTLQQNIKNIASKAKGDMNMSEVNDYNAAVGALNNKNLSPQARFQGYMSAKNMAIKKIALKHPEIAKKYGMGTAMQSQGQQQQAVPEGTKKSITFSDGSKGEAIMTNGKWEAHRL